MFVSPNSIIVVYRVHVWETSVHSSSHRVLRPADGKITDIFQNSLRQGSKKNVYHQTIFFLNVRCSVKVRNVRYCMNLRQKGLNPIMSTKLFTLYTFYHRWYQYYILGSYQLASVTEAIFCERNFFLWQKLLCLTENFFCDRNFFSVTEVCFSDKNLERNLFLWWKLVF